jgi:hypothetical protein
MVLLAAFFLIASAAWAQNRPIPARIVQDVDNTIRSVLTGNTYYLAQARFDEGAAPASLPMQRMLMLLRRSPQQEAALEQFLQDQQNSASPNYHSWLTPQQFGAQYGPAPQDIQTVETWLESQGFAVNRVSNGAMVIEFSGTAGQVQSAFRTTIHKYSIDGAEHWANSSDPSIPAALAPVVAGIDTLHNFPRKPMHVVSGVYTKNRATHVVRPVGAANPLFNLTCGTENNGNPITCYFLGPYDFGTIYNVLPLWSATPAIDGTGETIAIIGESDVDMKDIESFQSLFGLPTKDPVVVLDGPDPGVSPGDETESDLDLEWSGSVAKGATIKFVISATTNTTLGVDLAAQFAVDQNIAPIMSESYGICEAGLGTTGNQFFNSLWQQAAAQGITVILSAGDSGSAGCDSQDNRPPAPAEYGLQVSGFASTPYNVAVGGTDFNDIAAPLTYWNAASAPTTEETAKGYIPEVPWNDTCTSPALSFYGYGGTPLANCNNSSLLNIAVSTLGGSGGKSGCTIGSGQDITSCSGGYAKPAWQTGKGVPADGKRDIPDVSFFAATGFYTGSSYVVCAADQTSGIYCDASDLEFLGVGGTSASAPSFAGIMAMVVQKTGARQGNANYVLYNLAAQTGASCASAPAPASTCVFYDVTTGTNAMACDDTVALPVNCGPAGSEGLGILTGYNAGAGYDLATGLGSVNAANLVKNWATFSTALKPSATTLTLSPSTGIVHGSAVNVTIGVAAAAPATGTPTGSVSLEAPASIDPGITGFALTTGTVSSTTDVLPGGSYSVSAHYPGDGTFAASDSAPVPVTVAPEASNVAVSAITVDSSGFPQPFTSGTYGSTVYPRVDVTGASGNGFPSGNVTLKDNNQAINGGLTLPLNSQGNALPTNPIFNFAAGSHSLSASYVGDASFKAGTSVAPAGFFIDQAPTGITAAVSPIIQLGSATTISAQLGGSSCGNPPTGSITFFDGTAQLGAAQTIQATVLGPPNCAIEASASVNTAAFTQGTNSISAKYSGDTNYAASVTLAQTLDAQAVSTSTLSASPTTIQQGQSVTLTAAVKSGQAGGPAPSGTVSFAFVGPQSNVSLGTATVANSQAQLSTTALPAGAEQIFASYSGDLNYTQSGTSNIVVQVTPGPDFSLTFAPAMITVPAPGSTGTTMVTVSGSNGFSTPINFAAATCAGLPRESTCSFSPASVPVGGTTTLTILTTAPSFVAPGDGPDVRRPNRLMMPVSRTAARNSWQPASLVLLVLAGLFLAGQMRARNSRWFAMAMLVALLVVNAACGGGGGGGAGGTGPTNPGTPVVQNQVVTVTVASGTITHNFTFTLTVN